MQLFTQQTSPIW